MDEMQRTHDNGTPPSDQETMESPAPWLGWISGPVAWAMHHVSGYAVLPWLCEIGNTWPYHALSAFAVILCAVGVGAAIAAGRSSKNMSCQRSADRLHFMSLGGYILSAGSFIGIAISYSGAVWLGLC